MVDRRIISVNDEKKLKNSDADELKVQLERTMVKLYRTELLLSVTQKISGINNSTSSILLIKIE